MSMSMLAYLDTYHTRLHTWTLKQTETLKMFPFLGMNWCQLTPDPKMGGTRSSLPESTVDTFRRRVASFGSLPILLTDSNQQPFTQGKLLLGDWLADKTRSSIRHRHPPVGVVGIPG